MCCSSSIKPGVCKLTFWRGQSSFSIVFIFVSYEHNDYFRVIFVEQLSFDCRSYCERSCRMQGVTECSIFVLSFLACAYWSKLKDFVSSQQIEIIHTSQPNESPRASSTFVRFCGLQNEPWLRTNRFRELDVVNKFWWLFRSISISDKIQSILILFLHCFCEWSRVIIWWARSARHFENWRKPWDWVC